MQNTGGNNSHGTGVVYTQYVRGIEQYNAGTKAAIRTRLPMLAGHRSAYCRRCRQHGGRRKCLAQPKWRLFRYSANSSNAAAAPGRYAGRISSHAGNDMLIRCFLTSRRRQRQHNRRMSALSYRRTAVANAGTRSRTPQYAYAIRRSRRSR